MIARQDLLNSIEPHYHLIAVWDYLEEYRGAPWGTANILLDDFQGKDSFPWRRIGEISNKLYIIPHGDKTYPILSLADLTMDYLKDEVEEWTEEGIQDKLEQITPDDSAFVQAKSITSEEDIRKIVPISNRPINRRKHYPHPIFFIDRAGIEKHIVQSFDLYHEIAEYVYNNFGAVKYFKESEDRDVVRGMDWIVCLDDNLEKFSKYNRLNSGGDIVLDVESAFEVVTDGFRN